MHHDRRGACSPDERSDIRGRPRSLHADPGFHFVHPGYEETRKNRRRNAGRRCSVTSAPYGAARALSGALACRRSTAALTVGPFGPRASTSGQASCDVAGRPILYGRPNRGAKTSRSYTGVTRARLSQSRDAPPRPVVVPDCLMPEAARGAAVTSRRPRAPHSLRQTGSPADDLSSERDVTFLVRRAA